MQVYTMQNPHYTFGGIREKRGHLFPALGEKLTVFLEEIGAWTNSSRMSIQEALRPLVCWEGAGLGTQVVLFAQNLPETSTVQDKIKGECGGGVGY